MRQLAAALIVALAIVAVTIAVVTASLGPYAEDDDHGRGGDRQEQQDHSGRGRGGDNRGEDDGG